VRREAPAGPVGPFSNVERPNCSITLAVKATSVADPGRVSVLQNSARHRSSQSRADAVVLEGNMALETIDPWAELLWPWSV
jgi:hypothetical protein